PTLFRSGGVRGASEPHGPRGGGHGHVPGDGGPARRQERRRVRGSVPRLRGHPLLVVLRRVRPHVRRRPAEVHRRLSTTTAREGAQCQTVRPLPYSDRSSTMPHTDHVLVIGAGAAGTAH